MKTPKRSISLSLLTALAICSTNVSAQETSTVSGRVTDNTGAPLAGCVVMVDGTSTGTVTNADGTYQLQVPAGASVTASFLGYDNTTLVFNGQTVMDFTLFDGLDELEELMEIGFGTQKKSTLTGAISVVKSEDILLSPTTNTMEALQGKVAGLDVTRTSGSAGADVNISLRGTRSFSADGEPIFIIDGLPGDYTTINPADIESIEVLKDAASTAIYGANGSNGVVLITTRNGKEGPTVVRFSAYAGPNGWSKRPEMRSGETYLQGLRDAQRGAGNTDITDEQMLNNMVGEGAWDAHNAGQYINWADALLGMGSIQSYSLSVASGSEHSKSYFSLNFSREEGEYRNDDNRIYSSSYRMDRDVRDWLTIGMNARMAFRYSNEPDAKLDDAMRKAPLGTLYDENGNVKVSTFGDNEPNYLLTNHDNFRENHQDLTVNIYPYIQISPMEGLTWLSRAQGTIANKRTNEFVGMGSYRYYRDKGTSAVGTNDKVYASIRNSRSYSYKWENVLNYSHIFADVHDVAVTAVSSWGHNQSDATLQTETNILDNAYLWHNMGQGGTDKSTTSSSYSMTKSLGFVGRVSYAYADKYLGSFSVRHDGSSQLSADNRWDTFPAFSLGWRISEEDFMSGLAGKVNNLKVRFGWGVTGTASIEPYSSVSNIEHSGMSFSGENADVYFYGQNYSNPSLSWEKSYNTNVGIDAELLDGRLALTADAYKTRTEGIIWQRDLPITDGGYSATQPYVMAQNICETENKGLEITLASTNIQKDDWEWTTNLTLTVGKEEITKLTGSSADHIQHGTQGMAFSLGEAVNAFYHYKIEGVWQNDEAADAAVFGKAPGDYKLATDLRHTATGEYRGVDADGKETIYTADNRYTYSTKDYRTLGHNNPDWTMGMKNTVRWRGLDLSMFLYWRQGQMIRYGLLETFDPKGVQNYPTYFKPWTAENGSNDFAAANADRTIESYTGYAARAFVDGSYFKVKNVTLGYSLPENLKQSLSLTECRVYCTIANPIVHTKSDLLKDYDPESNGSYAIPLTHQIVFGLNITF